MIVKSIVINVVYGFLFLSPGRAESLSDYMMCVECFCPIFICKSDRKVAAIILSLTHVLGFLSNPATIGNLIVGVLGNIFPICHAAHVMRQIVAGQLEGTMAYPNYPIIVASVLILVRGGCPS